MFQERLSGGLIFAPEMAMATLEQGTALNDHESSAPDLCKMHTKL